jgi:ribonuclease HI
MRNNIFLISDASYSDTTHCAGLGVIDLSNGKKYIQSLEDIETSSMAEYRAILLSVQVALKNNYDNVVFVYDNKSLDLESLQIWLNGKIQNYQFLWLKRVYVKEADKLARKARSLQEKLDLLKPAKKKIVKKEISNKQKGKELKGAALIEAIKKKSLKEIVKFCGVIGSDNDRRFLKGYTNCLKTESYEMNKASIKLFMLIHGLLPKTTKKNFFRFVQKRIKDDELHKKFVSGHQINYYSCILQEVIQVQKSKTK